MKSGGDTSTLAIQPTAQTLAGIELFSELDAKARGAVAARCRARRYGASQSVLGPDDPTRDVLFIVSGSVRVTLYSPAGKEVIFRDQGAGEFLGELSAIDGAARSAHVLALTDCLLLRMTPEVFWSVLVEHPSVNARVLRRLTRLVRSLSERVYEFSTLPVPARVRTEVLRLARQHADGDNSAVVDPAPTHAEMASTIGTHREAVTRELNELDRLGLIERHGHCMRVPDLTRLAAAVNGDVPG
jgi:CRP/FNR family transcriptional regulator, cyclic AMP receptor protein